MPTLRQLSYLVALSQELHFRRAAELMNVTQPTLSLQLQELERQLGASLIERNSGQVKLTPLGREIVERSRQVLSQVEDIKTLGCLIPARVSRHNPHWRAADPGPLFAASHDTNPARRLSGSETVCPRRQTGRIPTAIERRRSRRNCLAAAYQSLRSRYRTIVSRAATHYHRKGSSFRLTHQDQSNAELSGQNVW